MANNSTNSNYVNISNLPQTQQAVDSDLLLLQTENGTQTITFNNFNVVKTDPVGNATVTGGVTGNGAQFNTLSALNYIASPKYFSSNNEGYTALNGFYNRFTLNGGIVTSATYVEKADPDYNFITLTLLPAVTAWLNGYYSRTVDILGSANANPNSDRVTITVGGFFQKYPFVTLAAVKPYHIFITTDNVLSAYPYIPANSISKPANTSDLQFEVRFSTFVVPNLNVQARVLIPFTFTGNEPTSTNCTFGPVVV